MPACLKTCYILHVPVQQHATRWPTHQVPSPHCVSGSHETRILPNSPTPTYRFPSRSISKWQNEKTSAELTHTGYFNNAGASLKLKDTCWQRISVSSGVQLKISKNSCGRDAACHNLWAFVLRLEVHMPTRGPGRQSSLGISPLNQKIHFSIGREPPSCHSTLKQFTRKLMAKSTRANGAESCACKMRLSETPWALPQPCQSLQGAGPEDTHLGHILELSLSWSAHWRQELLSPGAAEVQIRISTAAVGPQKKGKERVYFLLVIQKDTDFPCVLLSLMREGTTTRKLFLS